MHTKCSQMIRGRSRTCLRLIEHREETLRLLPAALLLSIAGLSLARPAVAAEVRYDPGDKVYFTYCYSHPPAMRIKPGDSVITSTRDASNDAFSVSDKTVAAEARPHQGQSADRSVLRRRCRARRHAGGPYRQHRAQPRLGMGCFNSHTSGCSRRSTRPRW